MKEKINIFWFRRDLRLNDNVGLFHALEASLPVLPIFIFDKKILGKLSLKTDARVTFIYHQLEKIKQELEKAGRSLKVLHSTPLEAFQGLWTEYEIKTVFTNRDYEPDALERDTEMENFLKSKNIGFLTFKDHVIFEKNEIVKDNGEPYTVFTPYSKKWKLLLADKTIPQFKSEKLLSKVLQNKPFPMPTLENIGFEESRISIPMSDVSTELIANYALTRDIPSLKGTSRLGIHLRFGTVSIREITIKAQKQSETFLNELIWRNFFIDILWHFPHVVNKSFKPKYDFIQWRNDEKEFEKWCRGETGFPMVDAGMRELNETGFMHNRVRMVTASFLVKHLLIDWRWGEAYFAEKLLDFELASNNGNWQWAAGCGCDAAPYFRIFNPESQQKRFDPEGKYILKWVPEYGTLSYPQPMVEHTSARERTLATFKRALK